QTVLARLPPGHHATERGQDVDSHAAEHARDLGAPYIYAAPGTRHSRHIRDRGLIIIVVLQVNADDLVAFLFRRLEVRDVALFFQNAGDLRLQVGSGNIYFLVPRANRV